MAPQEWLDEIYQAQAPALFRFLIRLTGDESETKDILQEIFVRLARSPGLLDGVAAPRSYLFRMAHRLVIDRQRREQARQRRETAAREELPSTCPPGFGDDLDAERLKKVLGDLLASLPSEQKAVVLLKVWEEMTFAEIAAVLDIPPNTAASRYRYALDKLRDRLRPLYRELL